MTTLSLPLDVADPAPEALSLTPELSRPRRPHRWGWLPAMLLALVASQIPYARTWRSGEPIPYDAVTCFAPIFSFLRERLAQGQEVFGIRHEMFGGFASMSYAYSNPLRIISALLGTPNTYAESAFVQVLHVLLAVSVFALLLRSFTVPPLPAWLGGFVFMTSGIHLSLAQHTIAQEALVYLCGLFWLLRIFCLRYATLSPGLRLALLGAAVVAATTVARAPQEAVSYFLPCVAWALWHGWEGHRRLVSDVRHPAKGLWIGLLAVGAGTALCSAPQVLTWLEMADTNRVQVSGYQETGRYFTDVRVLFAGLIFPRATGSVSDATGDHAWFLTDRTLGYVFAGRFAPVFLALYLLSLARARRWRTLGIFTGSVVLCLGYAPGHGAPVHWLLCQVFPPLGKLHHYYYGMHLYYGLAAFAFASALGDFCRRPRVGDALIAVAASVTLGSGIWLLLQFGAPVGGLYSDPVRYGALIDKQWRDFMLFNLGLLAVLLVYAKRLAARTWAPAALGYAVFALTLCDFLPQTLNQHFVPGGKDANLSMADGVIRALRQRPTLLGDGFRNPRVLALNLRWYSDLPLVAGCDTLKSGDTIGATATDAVVDAMIEAPDAATLRRGAESLGVDYLWVRDPRLRQILTAAAADFEAVPAPPLSGSLWRLRPDTLPRAARPSPEEPGALEITWWQDHGITRTRSAFGSSWTFDLPVGGTAGMKRAVLPLQAMRFFEVRDANSGQRMNTGKDAVGRLVVNADSETLPARLLVRYPGPGVTSLLQLSLGAYLAAWLAVVLPLTAGLASKLLKRGVRTAIAA